MHVQLENQSKKKAQGSLKIKARFLTLPEIKEAFEAQERERLEKERQNAQKNAEKSAEKAAQVACISKDMVTSPFSSYKCKDDP